MGSATQATPMGHEMRKHFLFDPKWTNLNQGSYSFNFLHPLKPTLPNIIPLNESSARISDPPIPGSFGIYSATVNSLCLNLQSIVEHNPDKFLRWTYRDLLNNAHTATAKYVNVPRG